MAIGEYNSSHLGTTIDSAVSKVIASSGSGDNIVTDVNASSGSWDDIVAAVTINSASGNTVTNITDKSGSGDDIVTAVNTNSASWAGTDIPTEITTGSYSLLTTDKILHVTHTSASAVTITGPTAQITNGRCLVVKDASFSASVNNIMIATEGSELIDNETAVTMSGDGDSYSFYCYSNNIFIK